jgi:hypothetical protein
MVERTFEQVLQSLAEDEIKLEGEFLLGSNYTFLVRVHPKTEDSFLAVYKPQEGERILWDFPDNTLAHREVAAYLVSQALDWNLVPPTVYRGDGPFGAGSVQLFIDHDPNYHYFNLSDDDFQRLRPVALFDLLANNADRKGGHVLFDPSGNLWSIDHGLCFNVEEKLRTVIWDFAGEPIPGDLREDLVSLRNKLESPSALLEELQAHLSAEEITILRSRADRLLKMARFPYPPKNRRAYPYPPV